MAQLFVQCVFYIALGPTAPASAKKQTLEQQICYTKSAFNLQFCALFREIDSRCGMCMRHEKKRTRFYLHELQ